MEAIVLAGGVGTRLRQVVPDLPKPMAPVAGRPFLEILLYFLARKGFTRVVLSLGFMADKVVAHFGDQFAGMELVYEIEHTPLGTGGAVRLGLTRIDVGQAMGDAGNPVAVIPPGHYAVGGFRVVIAFPCWRHFVKLIVKIGVVEGVRGILLKPV